MSEYGICIFSTHTIYRGFKFVQFLDFTCPGMSSFFGQKMENVQVFGKAHLVTLHLGEN